MKPKPDLTLDINQVAAKLDVPSWDVALIGDGAGSGWDHAGGWACILIDRYGGGHANGTPIDARRRFAGGMNSTSIGITELLPYIHAMLWYDKYHGKPRRAQLRKAVLDVLVITDCKNIARQGQELRISRARIAEVCRATPLWAVIAQLERVGYRFSWAWQERGTLALNALADCLADAAKHAAAHALSQALAHTRNGRPDAPDGDALIYLLNSAAYAPAVAAMEAANPLKIKRYAKISAPAPAGFDPATAPG